MLKDHAVATEARAWESDGFREVRAARWRDALEATLARLPAAAKSHVSKSAAWKIVVATHLKETIDVSNGWLAEHVGMGLPFYVSKHVGLHRRRSSDEVQCLLVHLANGKKQSTTPSAVLSSLGILKPMRCAACSCAGPQAGAANTRSRHPARR